MKHGRRDAAIKPIASHISSQIRGMFIFVCLAQILIMTLTIGFLTYEDAIKRAKFLASSNSKSLGMALSTGDLFQLKAVISSFQSEDTPYVQLLRDGKDLLAIARDAPISEVISKSKVSWDQGSILIRTDFPVVFNNIEYGRLVFKNRLRINDWIILCVVILLTTLAFFFVQAKFFEKFSLYLGQSISGIAEFFSVANNERKLNDYNSKRVASSFTEVESIASEIHSLLGETIRANEVEKESEKYRAVAKVTAHVAHDLRHPLSVFEAVSKAPDWNSFSLIKPELKNSLARIANMIDGLRNTDTSRLVRLSPNRLTLGQIVAEASPIAREKGAIIRCEGTVGEIHCMMDLPRLTRAIHNLIFNALEAGASEVVIRCNPADSSHYHLEVIDNGPGVPEHFVSKLFLEGETFGKVGGTGLGLSSVNNTISLHRGSISYQRKDSSTLFLIKLPLMVKSLEEAHNISNQEIEPAASEEKAKLPRVLVKMLNKDLENEVLEWLAKEKVQTLLDSDSLRSSDIIYTDDDDLVLLSITKIRAMTLRHSGPSIASEIAMHISAKYHLKVDAIEKKNGES